MNKWLVFIAMSLTVFMVDVDITAVNSALVTITNELHLDLSTVQWVINGYLIAAASLMAFAGRISDIYGHRRLFIIGMVAFTITSLATALAMEAYTICIARFLQGACMAIIFPLSLILTKNVFPKDRHGQVIGWLIAVAGISQALGPSLGGILIACWEWRLIFLLNIPLGIIVIVIVWGFTTKDNFSISNHKLNSFSVILFVGALMLLMFAINHIHANSLPEVWLFSAFIFSIIMLIIFFRIELGSYFPLLPLNLLKNRNFIILNSLRTVTQLTYFGILFMLGMLLESSLKINAFYASVIMSSLTLTFGVASLFTGRMADQYGDLPPIIMGLILMLMGYLGLALIGWIDGMVILFIALACIGLASALLLPSMTNSIIRAVPQEQIGAAMGLYFTNGYFSASLGIGLAGFFISMMDTKSSFISVFSQFMWLCLGLLIATIIICLLISTLYVVRPFEYLKFNFKKLKKN